MERKGKSSMGGAVEPRLKSGNGGKREESRTCEMQQQLKALCSKAWRQEFDSCNPHFERKEGREGGEWSAPNTVAAVCQPSTANGDRGVNAWRVTLGKVVAASSPGAHSAAGQRRHYLRK